MAPPKTALCKCGIPTCVVRSAADYDLTGTPPWLRMLALLHAAGQDVSDYFDFRFSNTQQIKPKSPFLGEGDGSHW